MSELERNSGNTPEECTFRYMQRIRSYIELRLCFWKRRMLCLHDRVFGESLHHIHFIVWQTLGTDFYHRSKQVDSQRVVFAR